MLEKGIDSEHIAIVYNQTAFDEIDVNTVERVLGEAVPISYNVSPESAQLNHFNFHPLEVVSRYRDPQLQVAENCSHLFKESCLLLKKTFRINYSLLVTCCLI